MSKDEYEEMVSITSFQVMPGVDDLGNEAAVIDLFRNEEKWSFATDRHHAKQLGIHILALALSAEMDPATSLLEVSHKLGIDVEL